MQFFSLSLSLGVAQELALLLFLCLELAACFHLLYMCDLNKYTSWFFVEQQQQQKRTSVVRTLALQREDHKFDPPVPLCLELAC